MLPYSLCLAWIDVKLRGRPCQKYPSLSIWMSSRIFTKSLRRYLCDEVVFSSGVNDDYFIFEHIFNYLSCYVL